MSKSLKCWLGLHLVAWLGTALSVLLLAAAVALLKTLSLQYLSLWSMADVSTALAGLAAAAGAALVAGMCLHSPHFEFASQRAFSAQTGHRGRHYCP